MGQPRRREDMYRIVVPAHVRQQLGHTQTVRAGGDAIQALGSPPPDIGQSIYGKAPPPAETLHGG